MSRGDARRLSAAVKHRAHERIPTKPYPGPERLAWDLQHRCGIAISPSTMKRLKRTLLQGSISPAPPTVWRFYERDHPHSLWPGGYLEKVTLTDLDRTVYQLTLMDDYSRGYVFCDLFLYPDVRTTIHALIAAMRQWQVIAKAVVFDNAQQFRGKLLLAFCEHLGIRLTHSAVNHPQTNGKRERAFRADMMEFYWQYGEWILAPLRRDLSDYVHYRNAVRGHRALGGKPSITRFKERERFAAPEMLDRLEHYACYEVKRKVISPYGHIPLLSRDAYVGTALAEIGVAYMELWRVWRPGLRANAWQFCRITGPSGNSRLGSGYAAYAAEIREFLTRILAGIHDDVHARLTQRAQQAKGGLALVEKEWQQHRVTGLAPAAPRVQMSSNQSITVIL